MVVLADNPKVIEMILPGREDWVMSGDRLLREVNVLTVVGQLPQNCHEEIHGVCWAFGDPTIFKHLGGPKQDFGRSLVVSNRLFSFSIVDPE